MMSVAEDPTLMYIMLLGLSHTTRALVRGSMRALSFSGVHRNERVWSFFPAPTTSTSPTSQSQFGLMEHRHVSDPVRSPPDSDGEFDLVNPTLAASAAIPTADALATLVGPCAHLEELTLASERALWCGGREAATFGGWVTAAFRNHHALHTLRIPNLAGLSKGALFAILSELDGQLRVLEVNTRPRPLRGSLPETFMEAVARHCPRVESLRCLGLRGQLAPLCACAQLRDLWISGLVGECLDRVVTADLPKFIRPQGEQTYHPRPAQPAVPAAPLRDLSDQIALYSNEACLRRLTLHSPECAISLMPHTLLDRLTDLSVHWDLPATSTEPILVASTSLRTFTCGTKAGCPARVRLDCPRLEVLGVATLGGWSPMEFELNTPRLTAIGNLNALCQVTPLGPLPQLAALLSSTDDERVGPPPVMNTLLLGCGGPGFPGLRHISGLRCGSAAELQALVDRHPNLVTLQRIRLAAHDVVDAGALLLLDVPPHAALRSLELILSTAESSAAAAADLEIRAPGLVHLYLDPGPCKRVTLATARLRHLDLRGDGIRDVRLACPLAHLRSLRVGQVVVGGLGVFKCLLAARLPHLRALHCSLDQRSPAEVNKVMRWLARMPRLTTLSLADVHVDTLDVTGLPRLARLRLADSQVARRFEVPWGRMEEVACVSCSFEHPARCEGELLRQCPGLVSNIMLLFEARSS
ncbi:hypothetical protein PAPYR_6813 [Paratrimastix pyriformis]|uniref:Uncharacterized protein n=1 Tax=Paratrimastix pyriformis TaxID=342808 RepID=A0ABQ8UH02_9EUKA|nr:hypothetical protein PAPYR_6813 [Paratrimastix pyriformis]